MKVNVIKLKSKNKEWHSILLDKVSTATVVVSELMGNTLIKLNLDPHGIFDSGSEMPDLLTSETVRVAFKDITEKIWKKKKIIINSKGGYITLDEKLDWEVVEIKEYLINSKIETITQLLNKLNN